MCVCALFKMYLFFPWALHSILRDRSFLKITEKDWGKDGSLISTLLASFSALRLCRSLNMYNYTHSLCGDVEHVLCRVLVTSSTSGLYGSFGEINYSAG